MKRNLFFIILVLFLSFSSACSLENDTDKTVQDSEKLMGNVKTNVDTEDNPNPDVAPFTRKDDFKIYHSKFKRSKYRGKMSPKSEHMKTKIRTERGLFKRKQEFRDRKNEELENLRREYEILEYVR